MYTINDFTVSVAPAKNNIVLTVNLTIDTDTYEHTWIFSPVVFDQLVTISKGEDSPDHIPSWINHVVAKYVQEHNDVIACALDN